MYKWYNFFDLLLLYCPIQVGTGITGKEGKYIEDRCQTGGKRGKI
jgi:hypothetical protein